MTTATSRVDRATKLGEFRNRVAQNRSGNVTSDGSAPTRRSVRRLKRTVKVEIPRIVSGTRWRFNGPSWNRG